MYSFQDFQCQLTTYEGTCAWTRVRSKNKLYPREKNCNNLDALIGSWYNPAKGTVEDNMNAINKWASEKTKNIPNDFLCDRKVWLKYIPDLYVIDIDEVDLGYPRPDFKFKPATTEEIKIIMDALYSKFPFLKDCVYTLSKNRKLPHIYVKITDMPKYKQEVNIFNHKIGSNDLQGRSIEIKGDLLKNKGVIESFKTEVFNYNPIKDKHENLIYKWSKVKWDDISTHFNTDKMNIYVYEETEVPVARRVERPLGSVEIQGDEKDNKVDLKVVRDVLEKILEKDPLFFDDYDYWFRLTVFFASTYPDDIQAYELYNEVCKTSVKYDEINNKKQYDKILHADYTGNGISIGTVFHWAKQLGINIKNEIYRKNIFLEAGESDIANLFVMEYAKENAKFDCDTSSIYMWSELKKLWVESRVEKGMVNHLTYKIDEVLVPLIEKISKESYDVMIEQDKDAKEIKENKKFFLKVIKDLKKSSYKNALWQTVRIKIEDRKFKDVVNKNEYEIATPTKIINLKTLEVRERTKDDFWTKTTPYEYPEKPTEIEFLNKYLSSLFVDETKKTSKELIDFVQIAMGDGLTNSTHLRSIYFLYGKGANGKSTFTNLINKVMGEFSSSGSDIILVDNGDNSRNKPELDNLRRHRTVFIDEIARGKKMNEKNLKNICGDNDITYKMPYATNEITWKCKCKVYTSLNDKPSFSKIDDQSLIDRIKIIPFFNRYIFTDRSKAEKIEFYTRKYNEMYNETECKKRLDKKIEEIMNNNALFTNEELNQKQKEAYEMEDKIKFNPSETFLQTLFWWLVQGAHKALNTPKMIVPEIVKNQLREYVQENDYIAEFIDQSYTTVSIEEWEDIYKKNRDNCITSMRFKRDLVGYCRENNIQHTMKIKEIEEYLRNTFGDFKEDKARKIKYIKELVIQVSNTNPMLNDDDDNL